jgi:molybdate transport system regulatory protein
VAKLFAERENRRKTSARNSFFGKVGAIRRGTVQTVVEVVSLNGQVVTSVITTDSLARLGLKIGTLVTAEVKAPWIQLCKDLRPPNCSAENLFQGKVSRVVSSSTTAEVVVCLADGTELCTVITEERRRQMAIATGDQLWAFFDAFTVVLHVD